MRTVIAAGSIHFNLLTEVSSEMRGIRDQESGIRNQRSEIRDKKSGVRNYELVLSL